MNIFIFTIVIHYESEAEMEKCGKVSFFGALVVGVLVLTGNLCFADTTNVYVVNNVSSGGGYGYGYNTMCTYNGGFCTNGNYIMSTSRTRYLQPQWKRQTLREKRMGLETRIAESTY